MNESISIKEGNIGRRIAPVDKIKVNTTSDDESMWVPSERGNTGVLYASENGIYIASEDGYESYSEVVVRVTEESFYGDKDFDHWDYEVPTDFPDLWDDITLNDFNVDPLAFDNLFNNSDVWDMDIPDLPNNLDFKMKDLKTKKPKKEKVVGLDPVSGNKMAIGLDNFGKFTQEILPSSIKIIQPPSKLKYVEGEYISISGIIVQAYTADGNVWSNKQYPNGIIPVGELTYSPNIATYDDSAGEYVYSDLFPDGVEISSGVIIPTLTIKSGQWGISPFYVTGGNAYIVIGGSILAMYASKEPGYAPFSGTSITCKSKDEVEYSQSTLPSYPLIAYTYNNKTVYYNTTWSCATNIGDHGSYILEGPTSEILTIKNDELAWSIIYGDIVEKECEMTVTVTWSMFGNLSDSYTVIVTKSESGGEGGGCGDTQAITYNGTRYVANEDMNAEAHYQSGTVWIRGEAKVWSVPDAVAFGLLKPEEEKDGGSDSGSEHEGGHF
jgi:hypothetical protein